MHFDMTQCDRRHISVVSTHTCTHAVGCRLMFVEYEVDIDKELLWLCSRVWWVCVWCCLQMVNTIVVYSQPTSFTQLFINDTARHAVQPIGTHMHTHTHTHIACNHLTAGGDLLTQSRATIQAF